MFYSDGILKRSDLFRRDGVMHGFSTRLGGVSEHPYTREMNLAFGREDPDETVFRNAEIFARAVSGGGYGAESAVCASQIHSTRVRYVTEVDRGDGYLIRPPAGEPGDGFYTDRPGVLLTVRIADCVPILLAGEREDGSPVIAAVHAGWRGTVGGIAGEAVRLLVEAGVMLNTVRAAVGPHIGECCFTVREDFRDAVTAARGPDFASRHIKETDGALHADLTGMDLEILREAGVPREHIDVSPDCTACLNGIYHSHRRTAGRRGAMGAGIVITGKDRDK